MLKVRNLTIIVALAAILVSAGAVFAQDDSEPTRPFAQAICRPDYEPGEHMSAIFGMDIDAIRAYIQDGGTLEELAEEQGIDLDAAREAFHEARLAELETCLTQAVDDGEITQAQADAMLERAQNFGGPRGPMERGERGFGQRGGHGPRGNENFGFGGRGLGLGQ